MKKYKVKSSAKSRKSFYQNSLIFSLIFAGALSGGMLVLRAKNLLPRAGDKVLKKVELTSVSDFLQINQTALSDTYILKSDLHFDGAVAIGDDLRSFKGTFDGNGHKIYLSARQNKSFIHTIDKLGKIMNLGLVFTDKINNLSLDFGGITTYNYGMIKNCHVYFENEVKLGNNRYVGGISALNGGTIENVVVNVKFNENEGYLNKYIIGGITGRNLSGGVLKRTISFVESTYLNTSRDVSQLFIPNISLVAGLIDEQNEASLIDVYTIPSEDYFFDRHNTTITFLTKNLILENEVFFNTLLFSPLEWALTAGELPRLLPNVHYS